MSDNKSVGGMRNISTVKAENFAQHAADFRAALATGKYDIESSYLSDTGAYGLFEKGHRYHDEEIEAAKAMADHGIIVRLTSEGGKDNITAKSSKGSNKYGEGKVGIEELTYEQSTREIEPKAGDAHKAVNKALEHAKKKGSDVAVIYDRRGYFHRSDISSGIKEYESHQSNKHRFKSILVISHERHVFEWSHISKK